MNGFDYSQKKFFKHKETKQIVFLVIYQGPATTVADYNTHECMNYKNSDFKEQFESIKAPFACKTPLKCHPQFEGKWHCVQCSTQEESQ